MPNLSWHTEQRNVNDILPYEGNPRRMTPKQRQDLEASLKKFNLVEIPAINTDNKCVSGHQRLLILQSLGRGEEVIDVRVPNRELTSEEFQEYLIRANKNLGEWDFDLLVNIGEEILLEAGFESRELDQVFNLDNEEDDFDVEKNLPAVPKSKIGEIYQLGPHRLACGDSTSPKDVEKLMAGKEADMVFMDPPFNMNYVDKKRGAILNDNMAEEDFIVFCEKFMARLKESTRTGGVFYICSGYQSYMPFVYAIKTQGMTFAGPIIWVKNMLGMGMNDYRHKHEMILKVKKEVKRKKALPILYGWNGGRHYFIDTHEEADVWNIGKVSGATMAHPTQKPIALITKAINNSSKRGDIVLDLFGGFGSTLIAAEKTGRVCFMCELDPKYVDCIISRWETLTGKKASK